MASERFIAWLVDAKCVEIALTVLLIGVIFISAERFVTLVLFADRRIRNGSLAASVRSVEWANVTNVIGDHSCLLAMMLRRCLASMPASELRHALDGEFHRLNRPTAMLRLIASAAPLGGLLGTVLGTMVAMGSTDPKVGISTALVTTAAGITVALSALIAAHFSEERLSRLLDDIEDICGGRH
jgi:biopolymer transport protein ExbB/TolQ